MEFNVLVLGFSLNMRYGSNHSFIVLLILNLIILVEIDLLYISE